MVDDAEVLDSASPTLLATLPLTVRKGLMVRTGARGDAVLAPSLQACRDTGNTCGLLPLDAAQTESLLRSVFADVPGVSTVATAIFGHCQGNPRATLEMAQHLVDTGNAHYDLGGWTLPARVESGDLPGDWAELLGKRLQELDQGAREWAEVMACAQPYGLPPALFAAFDWQRRYHSA